MRESKRIEHACELKSVFRHQNNPIQVGGVANKCTKWHWKTSIGKYRKDSDTFNGFLARFAMFCRSGWRVFLTWRHETDDQQRVGSLFISTLALLFELEESEYRFLVQSMGNLSSDERPEACRQELKYISFETRH